MSSKPFIITGLPRSRTAWLSVLFACNGVKCIHDASGYNSEDELIELIASDSNSMYGIVDSGLLINGYFQNLHKKITERWGRPKVGVIERNVMECIGSLADAAELGHHECADVLGNCYFELHTVCANYEHMAIKFDALNAYSKCAMLYEYVTDKQRDALPTQWFTKISRLNIQIRREVFQNAIERAKNRIMVSAPQVSEAQ